LKFQKDDYTHWILDYFLENSDQIRGSVTKVSQYSAIKMFCKYVEAQVPSEGQELLKRGFEGDELDKKERIAITRIMTKYYNYSIDPEGDGVAAATAKTRLSSLTNLFKAYHIDAYFDDLKKIQKRVKSKSGQKILTPEQMRDFFALHTNDFHKVAAYIRLCTGCRVGAIAEMRFSDFIDYEDDCMVLRIYPDDEELNKPLTKTDYKITGIDEYIGFLTPEASRIFKAYKKQLQQKLGTGFHELLGLDGKEIKIHSNGIKNKNMNDALTSYGNNKLKKLGVRENNTGGQRVPGKRSDYAATHHIRKYANTILKDAAQEQGLDPQIIEHWYVGHIAGLDERYRIVDFQKFFNEFKKYIPYLTINKIEALDIADRFKEESNKKEIESLRSDFDASEEKRRADNMLLQQLIELYKQGLSYEEAMKKMKFPKNFYE
jgi:integrase